MVDELLVAEEQWLPQYETSVFERARTRLAEDYIEPGGPEAPALIPPRSPEEMRKAREDATKHVGEE